MPYSLNILYNYRSINDLSLSIRKNLYKIPENIDLIVGIPRSGMLAANIIALLSNKQLTDLSGFYEDAQLYAGSRLSCKINKASEAKNVLVVDDSVYSGASLDKVKEKVKKINRQQKITYCAIYSIEKSKKIPDIYFEIVPDPRLFEWNILNHAILSRCCVDIDGVLCRDPTAKENDDGKAYKDFIKNVLPMSVPSNKIGNVVTSRLEKYRLETENWLEKNDIKYDKLHMLDLPDAETRRRKKCHGSFKAEVYEKIIGSEMFIESDERQSIEISQKSGKPVICWETQKMYYPNISYELVKARSNFLIFRIINKIKKIIGVQTI